MPQAAIAYAPTDERRLEAAHLAMSALHAYERANPNDLRPRMAITAALDYGTGRLNIMTDSAALENCRQWAANAASNASNHQAKAAALAIAAACEPIVSLSAVQRLVAAALE